MQKQFGMRLLALVCLLLAGVLQVKAQTQIPTGKLPAGVEPLRYELDLEIIPSMDRFSGKVKIHAKLGKATKRIWLHGLELDVTKASVTMSDKTSLPATYSEVHASGVAKLETETEIRSGEIEIEISYSASFNQSFAGLYQVKRRGAAYAYTQFQATRARLAFPSFDEPRFKTPFDVAITVAGDDTAITNGPELRVEQQAGGKRKLVFDTTKPIPTYLVAFAVGEFDVVNWTPLQPNAVRKTPITLRGITTKGKGEAIRYALSSTQAQLEILENYFGIPYPYAKLDLVVPEIFRASGMENVGAIFYRADRILFDDNPSIYQRRGFAFLHAHELAHNWFGNLVTPAWWDDLWLNESFATWMSNKVVHTWEPENYNNRSPQREGNRAMWSDRLVSARQIRNPIRTNGDIRNAFDSITYSKGSAVLAMLEQYMGEEPFRRGIQRFLQGHQHGVVTADDFFRALASENEGVLSAFNSVINQPGIPKVSAKVSCEGEATNISLRQSRSLPLGSKGDPDQQWAIPICFAFDDNGKRGKQCELFEGRKKDIKLETNSCSAWVHPNEGGLAYLHFELEEKDWQALIDNFDALDPGEIISLVKSAEAGFEQGSLTADVFLRIAELAAKHPNWDVAGAALQPLRNIKNFFVSEDNEEKAKAVMRAIYRPALDRFELTTEALAREEESSDAAQLRGDIMWFMSLDAEDEELRGLLKELGSAYIGFNTGGEIDRSVIHPNLVRTALVVGAQEHGLPYVESLIKLLRNADDAVLHEHIIAALGYQTSPEIVSRLFDLLLEPETGRRDASQILRRQGRMAKNQQAILDWMKIRYDDLLAKIPSSDRPWLVWRLSGFCNDEAVGEIKAFFGTRSAEHQGGKRALSNVLEAVEICAAVAKNQKARTDAAIGAYKL
ncbi:MAG: M1 family aminopeptidase [Pseudomonadota bacterium]